MDKQNCDSIQDVCVLMRDTMRTGGPDDEGNFLDGTAGIALGHRRLTSSTSPSRTPAHDGSDGRYTIC